MEAELNSSAEHGLGQSVMLLARVIKPTAGSQHVPHVRMWRREVEREAPTRILERSTAAFNQLYAHKLSDGRESE